MGSFPDAAATRWLDAFADRLDRGTDLSDLFAAECYWRDLGAFTRNIRTLTGDRAPAELARRQQAVKATRFRLAEGRTPPRTVERSGVPSAEAIFEFDTEAGSGIGVVRLVEAPGGGHVARNLLTTLTELAAHPERTGPNRPTRTGDGTGFGRPNWLDRRTAAQAYADRDPDVLVVGGGQSGLALAARLNQLDVDVLVVDAHERPGDNWRKRYRALTLHNAVWLNDMPYMPFPPTWPVFVPKDKLANWFESYVDAMEIDYWGGATFEGGSFDHAGGRWEARIRRGGQLRALRPKHLVMATGLSGLPNVPDLPGLTDFAGEVVHAAAFQDGTSNAGKRALIIGTGNSAHDIAQDLHAHEAAVTMVQRRPTTVISLDPSSALCDASYLSAPTLEDSDLIGLSTPYPDLLADSVRVTARIKEFDETLIAALNEAGFRTDYGEDETGHQMKYMRRGGGYYLNVGCSELIAAGEISVVQHGDTDRFVPEGLRMRDGSLIDADLVVLATGYQSPQDGLRRLMGDEIAERVGPIWGYDEEGEVRNLWRPTAQPGLWFTAGNFQMCRTYSKVLAFHLRRALDEDHHPTT